MRTIEVNLYTYDELSDKAKLNALIDYQCDAEYDWGYDALKSLEQFMVAVGVDMYNYDIDWLAPHRSKVYYEGEPTTELLTDKSLWSYCAGADLAETFNETKSIELSVEKFLKNCADDYEYQLSEEGFEGYALANELWFDENGKRTNY